jgi:ribonuclease HI
MVYYGVANGRTLGIFLNWNDCLSSVKGYKNALYKKFETQEAAHDFLHINIHKPKEKCIPDYYVYTDGACSYNGHENACAGIGIFFGKDDIRNVSKKIIGKQTNNTAELTSIIETYFIIENDVIQNKKITIVTDSEYVIKCISYYGEKCFQKGWKKDIPNKELVKKAYELYKGKSNIQFIHIKAHTKNTDIHSIGNENADKLAKKAISGRSLPHPLNFS